MNDMQILKDSDLINLCSGLCMSSTKSSLKSMDQDFQINIFHFLVIKFFMLVLIAILNVNV